MGRKHFELMFLLFLLLASQETLMQTEARSEPCQGWIKTFHNPCLNNFECTTACKTEGYLWGQCIFENRPPKCLCKNHCSLM
ncbi:hypothetical protein RGQ29_031978 [Quercus rubra]|uniref:Knottin scorpion toxin-like domain-containing protein n=1 Tax=Quercus rubra TaxID=3512 RepID=A0AAN7I5B8_QUERU|nr:hypothetical protein RGQ29_031978 [Quercus rubra]